MRDSSQQTNQVEMKLKARLNLFGGTPNISINLTPSAASHFTLDSFNVDPITPVDPSWLLVRRTKSDVYPSGEALKLGCHLKPDVGLSVWGIRGACLARLGQEEARHLAAQPENPQGKARGRADCQWT